MVYRGKPSRGCKQCRSRKIRCDQETPECAQCIKADHQCSGYRDQLDLMFLDESSSVRMKVHAGDKSRKEVRSTSGTNLLELGSNRGDSASKSVSPPPRMLHPALQDQAIAFFFATYADVGPRDSGAASTFASIIYQQDRPDGALKTIVLALGLSGLSRLSKDINMRNAAISNYVSAISKTNELLRHPQKAREDTTLYAILSLALFESLTGCSPQSVAACAKHVRGIVTLLELRGSSQLDHEVGLVMYLRIRGHLIATCLEYYIPIPPTISRWSKSLDDIAPHLQPDNKLVDIVIEFSNIRSSVQARTFRHPSDIVSDLLEIDKNLCAWRSSLPSSWECKEYQVKFPTDEVLETTSLEYGDIWKCSIFIKWRCIRIHVLEFLLSFIAECGESKLGPSLTSDTESQLHKSGKTLQVLASEVASSIPYMIGYRKGQKSPPGSDIPAIGGLFSCWPLFVIGGMVSASDVVRAWSIRRLLSIGTEMGVRQGLSLAAVLRSRKDNTYWTQRLAEEPTERLPTEEVPEISSEDVLFDESSSGLMSRSDLITVNGQFESLRVTESMEI